MTIVFNYLVREYSKKLFYVNILVSLIILITSIFDTLTKFKANQLGGIQLIKLICYKLPYLISEISPILAMIAALIFLTTLLKTNQLTNLFNMGFSIIMPLKATIVVNTIFGLTILLFLAPLGSVFLNKYEILDKKINYQNTAEYKDIFLKENHGAKQKFIYIGKLRLNGYELEDIVILTIKNKVLHSRIDCKLGAIKDNFWQLHNCTKNMHTKTKLFSDYQFRTNITNKNIVDYIKQIHNVAIWHMPEMIAQAKKLGVKTNFFELYYYKQLFKPLVILVISLVPFYFFKASKTKVVANVVDSFVIGFCLFFGLSIITNILISYTNSAIISNILPLLLVSLFTIFRLRLTYRYPI
jgi:lipopolysaccharide export system permease protein